MYYAFSRLLLVKHKRYRRFYGFVYGLFTLILFGLFATFTYLYIFQNLLSNLTLFILLAFLTVAFSVFMLVYLPFLRGQLSEKLTTLFYEFSPNEGLLLKLLKRQNEIPSFAEELNKASVLPNREITTVFAYLLKRKRLYLINGRSGNNKHMILYFPYGEGENFFTLQHHDFNPPLLYDNKKVKRIQFLNEANVHFYATSETTNDKIYLRKVVEKHFNQFQTIHHERLSYTLTPQASFLVLNALEVNPYLNINKKVTIEHINDTMSTLMKIQQIIEIMVEKREVWLKKSLQ